MAQQEAQDVRARDGAAAAALLAAVIGILVLALMIDLAEAKANFSDWLKWDNEVGPLSGKTSLALIAWAASWPVLHVLLYRRDGVLLAASAISLVLFVAAMVLMFPPVFDKFAP